MRRTAARPLGAGSLWGAAVGIGLALFFGLERVSRSYALQRRFMATLVSSIISTDQPYLYAT